MTEAALREDPASIEGPSVGEIQAVLERHNPHAPRRELNTVAEAIAVASAVIGSLPTDTRLRIVKAKKRFRTALLDAVSPARQGRSAGAARSETVERSRGAGLGERISVDEGRDRLDRYATARPVESWAGPVAGAGEIENELGIPRSTLAAWHKRGAIVGLLRGERKRVYPLEQFVDARPLEGLAAVIGIAREARSAWLWLRQPHGALDGRTPLDALKAGDLPLVAAAAERDFA